MSTVEVVAVLTITVECEEGGDAADDQERALDQARIVLAGASRGPSAQVAHVEYVHVRTEAVTVRER